MDSLELLFENKNYEAVADLTRSSNDPKERLLRLTSLVILGRDEEALDDISKYQSLLEIKYPAKLMKLHMELLLKNRYFDEAKIALQHYQELPYISQAVEEFLREIPKRIEAERTRVQKYIPLDEICDILETETEAAKISEVMFNLKDYNLRTYVDSLLIAINREDVHPNLRTFGLVLLVDNKFDKEINFLSQQGPIRVNPSKIEPPFSSKNFNEITRFICEQARQNTTINEMALNLVNYLVMDLYPLDIDFGSPEDIAKAIILVAHDYVKEPYEENDKIILELRDKIRKIIDSTPTISM